MKNAKQVIKVIFLHGNAGSTTSDHWFPWLKEQLQQLKITVISQNFPDSHLARESVWLPFLKNNLKADKHTILIGHSSGAVAAMRFAEFNKVFGSILVAPYSTDLNDDLEKKSGYFTRSWEWQKIKANQDWIVQFNSIDDPYIPIVEARNIAYNLKSEYYEYNNHGHFGEDTMKNKFPEIVTIIKRKLNLPN